MIVAAGGTLVQAPAIDLDMATEFLVTRFGDKASDVEAVAQGEWSRAFAFRSAGADRIIRFASVVDDFQRDRAAARYASPDLPIPAVLEIGEAFDGYYAISVRGFGEFLEALDPDAFARAVPSVLSMLDALRAVELEAAAGAGGWRGDGPAERASWRAYLHGVVDDHPDRRTHGWRERLATRADDEAAFVDAFARMEPLVDACPEVRHLIHSDLLHGNVLVADDRVAAVFDWQCALAGDFLYDVAWFTFWSAWYPSLAAVEFRDAVIAHYRDIGLAVPDFDARLRCYEIHIGLSTMSYQAFIGDWGHLSWIAQRTRELATAS
jgi:aminoglycoside phosphotransferase (APT) family kinase protein